MIKLWAIAGKKLWFYVPSIWINIFSIALKNKMERPPTILEIDKFW